MESFGEEEVGRKVDEGTGVMNEGDKSSTTHVTRTVHTNSGVVWEGGGWQVFGLFKFVFLYTCYKDIFQVKKGK